MSTSITRQLTDDATAFLSGIAEGDSWGRILVASDDDGDHYLDLRSFGTEGVYREVLERSVSNGAGSWVFLTRLLIDGVECFGWELDPGLEGGEAVFDPAPGSWWPAAGFDEQSVAAVVPPADSVQSITKLLTANAGNLVQVFSAVTTPQAWVREDDVTYKVGLGEVADSPANRLIGFKYAGTRTGDGAASFTFREVPVLALLERQLLPTGNYWLFYTVFFDLVPVSQPIRWEPADLGTGQYNDYQYNATPQGGRVYVLPEDHVRPV